MDKDSKYQEFLKYNNSLFEYDKKIVEFTKSEEDIEDKGYLVDYDDFYTLKTTLNYLHYNSSLKRRNKEVKEDKIYSLFEKSDFYKIKKLEKLETLQIKSVDYIKNKLINQKYTLITKELSDIISNTKEKPISFIVQKNKLILNIKPNVKLELTHQNLNLDERSFDNKESDYEEIKNIFNTMLKYFNFENKVINQLNEKYKSIGKGYLVKNVWLDEWKKYCNYDYFKDQYFSKKEINCNRPNIQKSICNEIIDYREDNKSKYLIPSETKIIKINNKIELEKILEKDDLCFIDSYFKNCFPYLASQNDIINYELYNGEITILFRDKNNMKLKSKDNILSFDNIPEDEQDSNQDLKQLIKIFCFQKSLPDFKTKEYNVNKDKNNNIFLINKNKIQKYKNNFGYTELIGKLETIINKIDQIKRKGNVIDYDSVNDNIIEKIISDLENKYKFFLQKNNNDTYHDKSIPFEIKKKDNIEYIDTFEIINEDITNYFLEQKIIDKKDVIEGEIIIDIPNIALIFTYDRKNFYEIGHLNTGKEFIIEYLIKENDSKNNRYQKDIINNLKFGIQKLLSLNYKDKDPLWVDEKKSVGAFYCINNNNNNNSVLTNNKNQIIEDEFVNNIISFILLVHSGNLAIKENIKTRFHKYYSKNPVFNNGYLINKNSLIELKKLISYDEISKIIPTSIKGFKLNDNEINSTLNKIKSEKKTLFVEKLNNNKKEILQFLEKNTYKEFEFKEIELNNGTYFYPTHFEIITEDAYHYLLKILKINNHEDELSFLINSGKIFLKFNQAQDYDLNKFLFGYTLNIQNNENLNYELNSIFIYKEENQRNKDFEKIIKEKKIDSLEDESIIVDDNKKEIGKIYLVDNQNISKTKGLKSKKNDEDYSKLKNNIKNSVILYNEYSKLKEAYDTMDIPGEKMDEDYYLINSNYLKEIETILFFSEIKEKIERIKQKEKRINTDEDLVDIIFNNIKNEEIFNELNQNDVKKFNELNNKNIYELKGNNISNYFYYSNCQIINKEIYDLLSKIDNTFIRSRKFKSIYCIFSNKKAIIFVDNKIINVGIIDDNDIFVPELIVYSKDYKNTFENLSSVCGLIKQEGFNHLEQCIEENQIKFIDSERKTITANVYNLKKEEKNDIKENKPYKKNIISKYQFSSIEKEKTPISHKVFNSSEISEKLKELICLCLSKQNIERNYWRDKTKPEEVFLLNKNWLEQFDENNIKDLSKQINSIYSQNYRKNKLKDIISKIDASVLERLDNECKSNKSNLNINADCQYLNLMKKKTKIYEEFILINKEVLNKFGNNNIKNSFNNKNIKYIKKNSEDIIIINENSQYILLIGNYIEKNYSFDIKYIIDYKNQEIFKSELEYIFSKNIKDIRIYIEDNTIFSKKNDYLSPIFDDTDIIGICYKFNRKIADYDSDIDYSEIFYNENIMTSIILAFNSQNINNDLGNLDDITEIEVYLISFDNMKQIKEGCNYEKIMEVLNQLDNNIFKDENNYKKNLLKEMNINNYYELHKILISEDNANNKYNEYMPSIVELNIIPVKYIDSKNQEQNIMIYNNFELVTKNTMDKIFGENYKNINCYKCIFSDGKIILNIEQNKSLGNKDPVTVIGLLNENNIFIPEYILLYWSSNKRKLHLDKIKMNLIEFLQGFDFDNNNHQNDIIEHKQVIGIIIKYELNNDNFIPPKPDPDKDKIPETIPPPPSTGSIRLNFEESPLIGLENIGATCYMNATLQCFNHIEKFVDFFKYHYQPLSVCQSNPETLTYSFKLLIDKLWPDNFNKNQTSKKYYAPRDFKEKISKMNPLFEGIAANDSKDLVNFIIMTLHEELNKAKDSKNIDNSDCDIDQTNKRKVFGNFMETFIKNNKSIISDLFYSTNCSVTECCNCHVKLYNYQIYFFLVFPLEEIRKFKYAQSNQNMIMNNMNNMNMNFINFMSNNNVMVMNNNFFLPNNNIQQNNVVDIFDCFNYESKPNVMSGSNAMYCNYCKITCDSCMKTHLVTGPEILILLLNRGQGIQFDVKLIFTEYLDLSNYIEYRDTGYYYKLIGVITHIGESSMAGHFIAYCRDPLTDKWHKYNDAIVSDVLDYQNEIINFAMPYLLFYQKIK